MEVTEKHLPWSFSGPGMEVYLVPWVPPANCQPAVVVSSTPPSTFRRLAVRVAGLLLRLCDAITQQKSVSGNQGCHRFNGLIFAHRLFLSRVPVLFQCFSRKLRLRAVTFLFLCVCVRCACVCAGSKGR